MSKTRQVQNAGMDVFVINVSYPLQNFGIMELYTKNWLPSIFVLICEEITGWSKKAEPRF